MTQQNPSADRPIRYFIGPEFHRQLWLHFSPFKVLAAPVVIGLCAFTAFNLNQNTGRYSETLMDAMFSIFFIIVIVWGVYEAATAMQEEIRNNTWDFQCMSAISPFQMVVGKLFGATAYTWYAGFIALYFIGFGYGTLHPHLSDLAYLIGGLVLAGLTGQSLALLASLNGFQVLRARAAKARSSRSIGAFLFGFVGAVTAFQIVENTPEHTQRAWQLFPHGIAWYCIEWGIEPFVLLSLSFFVCWFVTGCYRLTRTELMYRSMPFVWLAFVVSFIAWQVGFLFPHWDGNIPVSPGVHVVPALRRLVGMPEIHTVIITAFLYAAAFTYFAMVSEASELRRYARLAFYWSQRNFRAVLENTPKWAVTAPLVLGLYLAAIALSAAGVIAMPVAVRLVTSMLALMLFMVRDGLVIHAIYNKLRPGGSSFAVVFYYFMAYALLPMAFLSAEPANNDGQIVQAMMDFSVPAPDVGYIPAFFYPIATKPLYSILPVLAQALLAASILRRILRKKKTAGVIENKP